MSVGTCLVREGVDRRTAPVKLRAGHAGSSRLAAAKKRCRACVCRAMGPREVQPDENSAEDETGDEAEPSLVPGVGAAASGILRRDAEAASAEAEPADLLDARGARRSQAVAEVAANPLPDSAP